MLPFLSSADFSTFLHVLLDCPYGKFLCPASQLYMGVWGQSCSAALQAWSMARSVHINSSRNVNSKKKKKKKPYSVCRSNIFSDVFNRNIFRVNFHTSITLPSFNMHSRKRTFQEARIFFRQTEKLSPHNLLLGND